MTAIRPENFTWLTPYLCVKDADQAIAFYQDAFGFETKEKIPDEHGKTCHAEMKYQDEVIFMLGSEGLWDSPTRSPATSGVPSPVELYIYCENVDAVYERAVKAGANSILPPADMFWGDRMCKLSCPSGHAWNFAQFKKQ